MRSKFKTPDDLENIFHQYNDKVFAFVLKNLGNRELAKDITQEVFLKICLRAKRFRQIEDKSNYIYLMTRNLVIDHFRKASHELDYRKTLKEGWSNPVEKSIHHAHYKTVLDDALDQLPPRQKTIFIMYRQQGQTMSDIAECLGISYFTVKNHIAEARKNLKKLISPEVMYGLGVIGLLFT
ncbi:RNA polymerase sigma factor [Membranihabitans maritimus]|uniref:RNA polymerase sigma factor n=1 Tax=Membranihabitans maritimus TaxID=2904244 RepID=UPI001F175C1C|nr:sigma-70 family RNA polymerase sigma factor [Membranihabitans maritimus]